MKHAYDSEKVIQCFYCGCKLQRKGLLTHTRSHCVKANGRKPREAVPKGQSLLSFTKKTLKDKVQESAQQVKISDLMQLESKESDERDHIQPGHSLKRKRNDDDDKLDSKRSKSWIEAQLDFVLNFFSKFIPELHSDIKKL